MPRAGFNYERNNIITLKLFRRLVREHGLTVDYKTFKNIIEESNQTIFDIVSDEPDGFKLPENLGYIVVSKFISTKKSTDWKNSVKYKKAIYHTNLHSFGYKFTIKWCKFTTAKFKYSEVYKFKAARFLTRKVSKNILESKVSYFKWENSDFWAVSKMDRSYNKKFKNED